MSIAISNDVLVNGEMGKFIIEWSPILRDLKILCMAKKSVKEFIDTK
jgi:hypothetical protein